MDTRRALTDKQVAEISIWRARPTDSTDQKIAREEAVGLAKDATAASARLKQIKARLADVGELLAPGLQAQPGLGPATVGIILASCCHCGRIRNEAAFAHLAGAAPLRASSGNTIRHRLNRHGDRQLNMALDVVIDNRMQFDDATKTYMERRTAERLNYRKIQRYLVRSVFQQFLRVFA